jgi:hypothetical protein
MKITINDLNALSPQDNPQMKSTGSSYLDGQDIRKVLGGLCAIVPFPILIFPRPPIFPIETQPGICPPPRSFPFPPPVICPSPPISPTS